MVLERADSSPRNGAKDGPGTTPRRSFGNAPQGRASRFAAWGSVARIAFAPFPGEGCALQDRVGKRTALSPDREGVLSSTTLSWRGMCFVGPVGGVRRKQSLARMGVRPERRPGREQEIHNQQDRAGAELRNAEKQRLRIMGEEVAGLPGYRRI